jgi:hypothetical protein
MNNQQAIETFNILSQVNNEKGYPVKFMYGLARLINKLEPIVKSLNAVQSAPIEGQQEYNDQKQKVLQKHAKKDEGGKAKIMQTPSGQEYMIEDMAAFNKRMELLDKEYADTLTAVKKRVEEYKELLEKDVEDFEPYMIKIKTLPLTDEGDCKLSVLQLRYLIPFLDGDINDLPDTVE